MHKILVPYDGSASAKRALQYLADTIRTGDSVQVHVVNVQQNPVYFNGIVDGALMLQVEAALLEAGRKTVLECAETLQRKAIPHQCHVILGPVADTLAGQVETLGCEAVVMGTHGRGALSGLVLGSVATRVIHLVHVPVTLVK
jgi:nucleotide-binding universal stress UspA family protein